RCRQRRRANRGRDRSSAVKIAARARRAPAALAPSKPSNEDSMASETMDTAPRAASAGGGVAESARDTVEQVTGRARETVDQVTDRARKTMDQVADTAAGVADRVSAQASDALAQGVRYGSAHPLQALGVVLLAGFVIG